MKVDIQSTTKSFIKVNILIIYKAKTFSSPCDILYHTLYLASIFGHHVVDIIFWTFLHNSNVCTHREMRGVIILIIGK